MKKGLVCYCFQYTEEDIVRDVVEHKGASSILERISNEKRKGSCNCRLNHPEGR